MEYVVGVDSEETATATANYHTFDSVEFPYRLLTFVICDFFEQRFVEGVCVDVKQGVCTNVEFVFDLQY